MTDAELASAVDSFRRVRKDLLPPGTIHGIEAQKDGNVLIAIEMKFGPNVRNDSFILEHEFVVEALARFCIETNIVIPRGGAKKVLKSDKEWILEIRLKASEMAQHAAFTDAELAASVQTGIAAH
ncbi:hypothetical protein NUH88_15470 [Nisaea acidiphila]|uniref:Uncharacterized protein n=1 Tax=Nisaea acidiphila TaxID=1862145 RepID=A0A9J7ANM8_9PROT|nr:hypothetical protein [Nisaea acidiphila]UUX48799.1 hypothetical protein NUH88_15470 [Nisaea acidiphila]